ncbi:hypothetical protein Lal_00026927, partial [Lupinus albus]
MSSLPEIWDTLVVMLNNSVLDGNVSMDIVSDSLFNKNQEGRNKVYPSILKQILWRDVEEVKLMRRMDLVEEAKAKAKANSEVALNLTQVYLRKNGHKPTIAIATDDDVLLIVEYNYLNVAYGYYSWIIDSDASFHTYIEGGETYPRYASQPYLN